MIQFKVEIPKKLSSRERELLKELAEETGEVTGEGRRGLFGNRKRKRKG